MTYFDYNVKVTDSDIHTSVYDKRDEFGISPDWVVMFLDSHRMVFTFLSWLDLLGVALAFRISILKSSNYMYFQTTNTGLRYHNLRKTFGKFSRSYSDLTSKFDEISFQECFGKNLSPSLLRWSSLQTKEGQIWSEFRLVGL